MHQTVASCSDWPWRVTSGLSLPTRREDRVRCRRPPPARSASRKNTIALLPKTLAAVLESSSSTTRDSGRRGTPASYTKQGRRIIVSRRRQHAAMIDSSPRGDAVDLLASWRGSAADELQEVWFQDAADRHLWCWRLEHAARRVIKDGVCRLQHPSLGLLRRFEKFAGEEDQDRRQRALRAAGPSVRRSAELCRQPDLVVIPAPGPPAVWRRATG